VNFFRNIEGAKSFSKILFLIVDAAFVVVAPTNKVNPLGKQSVLIKLGFLHAYRISNNFIS
jgi:hypothetical protein